MDVLSVLALEHSENASCENRGSGMDLCQCGCSVRLVLEQIISGGVGLCVQSKKLYSSVCVCLSVSFNDACVCVCVCVCVPEGTRKCLLARGAESAKTSGLAVRVVMGASLLGRALRVQPSTHIIAVGVRARALRVSIACHHWDLGFLYNNSGAENAIELESTRVPVLFVGRCPICSGVAAAATDVGVGAGDGGGGGGIVVAAGSKAGSTIYTHHHSFQCVSKAL
jgi:hypothetical protein